MSVALSYTAASLPDMDRCLTVRSCRDTDGACPVAGCVRTGNQGQCACAKFNEESGNCKFVRTDQLATSGIVGQPCSSGSMMLYGDDGQVVTTRFGSMPGGAELRYRNVQQRDGVSTEAACYALAEAELAMSGASTSRRVYCFSQTDTSGVNSAVLIATCDNGSACPILSTDIQPGDACPVAAP